MQIYVGYGFNVENLTDEDLVRFAANFDTERFKAFAADCDDEGCADAASEYIHEMIEEHASSTAEYIRDIINGCEKANAGTDYIVSSYDSYLVFDSVRFADDSPRTKFVRTEGDFIDLIEKYLPIENIVFGNLYDGIEWADPCYYLD